MRAGCPLTLGSTATSRAVILGDRSVHIKGGEGADLWVCRGSPQVCLLQPLPAGASGERHWPWEGREKGLFLKSVPSLESDSGKLGPLPRPQLGLKGTSPQLAKPGMGPSWPGKMPPPSWCSLQTPSPGSLLWFPQKGQVASVFSKRASSMDLPGFHSSFSA